MRNFNLIILFIFTSLNLFAQNFNIVSENDTFKKLFLDCKSIDNYISTYSVSFQYQNTPIPYALFSFTKYDLTGNVVKDTLIGDTDYAISSGLGSSYKNGYFGVSGRVLNISTNEFNQYSAFIIKGDLSKSHKLFVVADTSYTTPFSTYVFPENENKIIMVGTGQPKNNLGTIKLLFHVLDTNNNLLLNKIITINNRWLYCRNLFRFHDNYFLIVNSSLQNNINDPTNLVIYKLDTLGNIVKTYQTTNGKWYGTVSSAVLPNGDFIVGGFYSKGYMTSNVNDGIWQQKYLARFDKDLNLIWRKTFGRINGNSEINKIIIASDSTIVGCGADGIDTFNGVDSIGHGTGCIFKFSLDGDSIWMHKYQGIDNQQYGDFNWMTNIDELPNNQGFVGCGYIDNYFPAYRRGWVFRTDANGCLDASCSDKIREVDEPEAFVNLYPNPANDKLTIQFKESSLYPSESTCKVLDATGREVLQINNLQQNNSLDISELAVGLYVLSIQTSHGKLFTNKFLVSR